MSYQKNNKDPSESDNNGNTSVVATLEKPKLKKRYNNKHKYYH